ncbi:MAG TPA: nitroreductase/quinone reductase family protein [Dehalococcoidia bacterium]|nr:nitroreductase/quinone reductase family protein [Dehalococcoidia bacterium]
MTAPGPSLAGEDYCYLTTTGRVTGKPHTIEIWFSLEAGLLYLLAGSRERADWVRNLRHTPSVQVRIRDVTYNATARLVSDVTEDTLARRLLVEKYTPRHQGELDSWGRDALPVAIDFKA